MKVVVLVALLCACKVSGTFECETSDQCRLGDTIGFCEPNGACAFEDTTCASHRRYDETASKDGGACADDIVAGSFHVRYIVNDEMHEPMVIEQLDPTFQLAVELDDGTTPPVQMERDGAFEFSAAPGQHYEVTSTSAAGSVTIQTDARFLLSSPVLAGRPDRVPVTTTTPIHFMFSTPATGIAVVSSTGVFTDTTTSNNATSFNFDWNYARSLSGSGGALDASKHDRLYFNELVDVGGYAAIESSTYSDITFTSGMNVTVSGPVPVVARDHCVHLTAPARAEQTRMQAAQSLSAVGASWGVYAKPARDLDDLAPFVLAGHVDATTPADADVMLKFANPYPMQPTATMLLRGTTQLAAFGASVDVSVSSYVIVSFELGDTSCAISASLASQVEYEGQLVVAGTPIDTDEKPVTVDRTKRIPVSWSPVIPGSADDYAITLMELTDDGAGGINLAPVSNLFTSAPQALLRSTDLQAGHTYALALSAVTGASGARKGDYVTFTYPSGYTLTWSRTFKVN